MKNQVIKNLSPEMGKEIIKYFQSLGVDTDGCEGLASEEDGGDYIYYGVINNEFNNYSAIKVLNTNTEIIELPTSNIPKRGDKVLVWDFDKSSAVERIFVTKVEGALHPIITVDKTFESDFLEGKIFDTVKYRHYIIVPKEETITELTLKDISNGKGVGVKPHLIRIKQ